MILSSNNFAKIEKRINLRIRIYYKDTDMGGIVYHSRYLDFCEMARSERFFGTGRSPVIDGCHFAVKKIEADYIKPAFLGDLLDIQTAIRTIRHTSVNLSHLITRNKEEIFKMEVLLVFLNAKGKPVRIDEETRSFFETLPRI